MISVLLFGFLLGMRHALEADHLAAVAALTTQTKSLRQAIRHGAVWGIGHTISLLVFCAAVFMLETMIPTRLADWLELGVGVMLIALGADVIRRMARDKVHYHTHTHGGHRHFHAHSHADETNGKSGHGHSHNESAHDHQHITGFPGKALVVGLIHGMAGSAALILLSIESTLDPWQGMIYAVVFGAGSIVGMAALSAVIAIPLKATAKSMTRLHNGLQAALGLVTIGIGGLLVYQY